MGHTTALLQPSSQPLPKLINPSPSIVLLSTISSSSLTSPTLTSTISTNRSTDSIQNDLRCKLHVNSDINSNNNVFDTRQNDVHECAGCYKLITERFLLKALDLYWHEDCLKCGCCDCRLGEVGSTLYTKANLILCKRDYLR